MGSMYSKFIKETLNWDIIEDDNSFVSYEIQNVRNVKCLKVNEMFVDKSVRGNNKWRDLMDKLKDIAQQNNCNMISAQISAKSSDFIQQRTIHLCRLYGMDKTYEDKNVIIYSRSI